MKVERREHAAKGIRFSIRGPGGELARAYLYVMTNDLHDAPFGLLEDVYVDESQRGNGLGTALVREVVAAAKEPVVTSSSPLAERLVPGCMSCMSD
jgi:GNAT superfamily N-acetyltransferase